MPQNVKQTNRTVQDNSSQTISRIMQVLFTLIQIFLIFRLALRLLGANVSNVFVNIIYEATAPLVGLFEGIFSDVMLEDSAIFAVFEPATVIAIIVTAAVAYIVLRLLSVKQGRKTERVEVQKQTNAVPLGQVSEAQLKQDSEPVAQPVQTPEEQTNQSKLENHPQEVDGRTYHQQQAKKEKLEKEARELDEKIHYQQEANKEKLENETQKLEEKIYHKQQILEEQQKMSANISDEDPVNKKPHRQ